MQNDGRQYITRQERYTARAQKQRRDRMLTRLIIVVVALAAVVALTLSMCGSKDKDQVEDTQISDIGGSTVSGSAGEQDAEVNKEPVVPPSERQNFLICIDPGHGYDDGGASSQYLDGVTEKDLTLLVSLQLRQELETMGFEVVMTRDSDVVPEDLEPNRNGMYLFPARNRPAVMNATGADVMVSIHCDSFSNESVGGMRVYYYNKNNPELTPNYANAVATGMSDRFDGAKVGLSAMDANSAYYVIRDVDMPAILIETGFVTNPQDAENLQSPQWRKEMAEGIAEGIYEYYHSLQNNQQ